MSVLTKKTVKAFRMWMIDSTGSADGEARTIFTIVQPPIQKTEGR